MTDLAMLAQRARAAHDRGEPVAITGQEYRDLCDMERLRVIRWRDHTFLFGVPVVLAS